MRSNRLPPEGQEMLLTFIDKGIYRPLGESAQAHEASVQIIGATTESSESFLSTFIDDCLWQSPCRILLHVHWMSV